MRAARARWAERLLEQRETLRARETLWVPLTDRRERDYERPAVSMPRDRVCARRRDCMCTARVGNNNTNNYNAGRRL
jgi:hypothetical protein